MRHNHLWHIIVVGALGLFLLVLLTVVMHLMDEMNTAGGAL